MNEYDEFTATMVDAGWSQEKIERAWQRWLRQEEAQNRPLPYAGRTAG